MNPNKLLNAAETAIQNACHRQAFRWSLWVVDNNIVCVPASEPPVDGEKVMDITRYQLLNGLTSAEWNQLEGLLRKIWEDQKL